jgi:hypothetical protein
MIPVRSEGRAADRMYVAAGPHRFRPIPKTRLLSLLRYIDKSRFSDSCSSIQKTLDFRIVWAYGFAINGEWRP